MKEIEDILKCVENYDAKIKRFCDPLLTCFGINQFYHAIITHSGEWVWLNLNQNWANYFFSEQLYLFCPFMHHPDNFKDGIVFPKEIEDANLKEILQRAQNKYQVHLRLVIVQKTPTGMEFFAFGLNSADFHQSLKLYNEVAIIKIFIKQFKQEFKSIYAKLEDYNVDAKEIMGSSFNELTFDVYPVSIDRRKFLEDINFEFPESLTERELAVVKELTKGLSSSTIAHHLSISPRTVENCLERVKEKLFCASKSELVHKARELEEIGIFFK